MSHEKDNKKKKTLYVPDEEVLAYSRAKIESEKDAEAITDTSEAELDLAESNTDIEEIKADGLEVDNSDKKLDEKSEDAIAPKGKKDNRFLRIVRRIIPLRSDDKKTIILKCVSIIAALALIVSGTYLSVYYINDSVEYNKLQNERNNYENNRNDYTKNEDNQFSKFDYLKTQNSDIVGWITIPNTEVDNPVYQTIDNQYYVNHDMYKKDNEYGAIFLDYRCDIDPKSLSQSQIIYGHNMRRGSMFGTLKEYRELDFYKQNPLIYFDSLYEQRVYKIFAIMVVNDGEDNTFGYTYTAYRTTFTSDADFNSWLEHSRERSLFDIPVDVNSQDEILVLSTCCYDYDNARFVLLARLVRDGEDTAVDTSAAVKNKDVIYSKEYYNKKKLPIPELTSSEETTSK